MTQPNDYYKNDYYKTERHDTMSDERTMSKEEYDAMRKYIHKIIM